MVGDFFILLGVFTFTQRSIVSNKEPIGFGIVEVNKQGN